MPGLSAIEMIERLRQRKHGVKTFVFTMHSNVSFAKKLISQTSEAIEELRKNKGFEKISYEFTIR